MKYTLLIITCIALSARCLFAADISKNFWDTYSERVTSLHAYLVEVGEYCQKNEVKELKLNANGAIALVEVLEAYLKTQKTPATPLSKVKRAVKVNLFLANISEQSNLVTSRILAFSKLTQPQKQTLIEKVERSNKLFSKLTEDVSRYIQNTAELGL
jgi:hypothetical protein